MTHSRSRRTLKAAGIMMLAVLGLAGLPKEAPAFQFGNGDLVLAIFGNNTEYYYDIGNFSGLLTPGSSQTFDVSAAFAPGAGVVGGPQTQWTIIGKNAIPTTPAVNGIFTYSGTQMTTADVTIVPAIGTEQVRVVGWNSFLNTSTGATPAGAGASVFLNSADPAAFTNATNFGLGGFLGGTWNDGGMQGSVGDVLNIIQGQARNTSGQTNILSDVGRAVLSASGQLTICGGAGCSVAAVPVPAAVWLFGSGLAAMAGLARRTGAKLMA